MIEFELFVEGLTKIGLALKQPYGAASLTLYHDLIGPQTTAEEWPRFVVAMLKAQRWPERSPNVPELQDALREFRGARPVLVEATEAYERVLVSGVYQPEGGTVWSYRGLKESCGEAAADAFLAAGGNAAFSTTWDEAKRRERFVAGYVEAVREEPMAALLPAVPTKALPPGEAPPSREEAVTVLRRLRDIAQIETEAPKGGGVNWSEDRLKELERQAREITGSGY